MIRLIAVAFALIVSTSAQAAPLAPLSQPDGMITQVREACGTGMHMRHHPQQFYPAEVRSGLRR